MIFKKKKILNKKNEKIPPYNFLNKHDYMWK